ncbi:hypothetical protein AGABI2DRAFT_192961 [Agaricus bisporus var. bisporus H97]|uniref:hypothetical protein n=1 Tax=Agaricus bisporus var. bisporus (strain H97 / ATCC MYA-4626 / FGSC 10389) TaxID=936046 RepID=UPI00029F7194|nr:hypothetical protein AGABI2DRAFT_192961 [Agaricus bisporus var. bisporus H97]EKV47812.1 hypothetical protein AGABI2DRAFT_192961 [Agaricus bisporus var. bisporus H97]
MAADAPPTAYKEVPTLVEWNSLTEEDQIRQQEEMTKFLGESDTTEKFIEECKEIGRKAVAIGGDFRTVLNSFVSLAERYGNYVPDLMTVYIPRWVGLMKRWSGSTGILSSSKVLAMETVVALIEYGRVLALIADIKTQSELEGAQNALRAYVARHPIDIATRVADGFKNLGIDLQDFSDDFAKYVGTFSVSSSAVVSLEASVKSIMECQATIADLNEKIQESAIALGCSSVFGILSDIPVGSIGHYVAQRNKAQANLVKTKSGILNSTTDSIIDDIIRYFALLAMQAEFEQFKPGIVNNCQELSSFANIWAFATEQSIEINIALNEGMVVLTRKKFQMKLELLIVQIEPLREGLRAYAAQI